MSYFLLSLKLSLRARLRSWRFWCALALVLMAGCLLRWGFGSETAEAAVEVGVVVPASGQEFWEALERHGGSPVQFVRTDEAAARSRVASSRWDCALVLPEDFAARLERGDTEDLILLLTGPGSTVYPLVRETAAAALLELTSARIASDYLLSSGIAEDADHPPETLPQVRRVEIAMETLTGRPLDAPALAGAGLARALRGSLAAALLVWSLFAAADLGRWRESGPARRMRPCLGGTALALPRLLAALLPALLLGAAGLFAAGAGLGSALALPPYLAALGALALLLSAFRPVWTALPTLIPFAAAACFVLSPVFADVTLLLPRLAPLCRWLPVTLYLRGCEGDWSSLGWLLVQAALLAALAAAGEALRQ